MADRVHPMPRGGPGGDDQQADADAPPTETTPLHPSFHPSLSPPPGTYIIQVPKDQVLRAPPPGRARRYKALASRPARRRRLRRACCCACAAAALLLLLAAAFAGAVYLAFRPRAPAFSVASPLAIRGLDAAVASPPATLLAPELDASVRADNARNGRVGLEYLGGGGGVVAVSYGGGRELARGAWPAFRQPPRNVTVVAVAMRGRGVRLTEEERRRLAVDRAAGAVPLALEARVPVRLRFGSVLRTWTVGVRARCEVTVDRLDGDAEVVDRGCRVWVRPLWWWRWRWRS
ncbi:hypothetical protein U9M48_034711 [Paspalum notatum var. saurae]|uniref:Late embryogenesis abundant protein LEA-2 subgroup domain-containing protein n=1 Tax=Paspalum notatum var. saurae TaxID=547442 RepID=A0AAQ3UBE6_PASNO